MPNLSGIYTSLSGKNTLALDHDGHLTVCGKDVTTAKLRADGEFWLCEDDGKVGKFGNPKKVTMSFQGKGYHIWVEPRGFSDGFYELGLVPVEPNGEYSNRFLAVDAKGSGLEIHDNWSESAKFRCVE